MGDAKGTRRRGQVGRTAQRGWSKGTRWARVDGERKVAWRRQLNEQVPALVGQGEREEKAEREAKSRERRALARAKESERRAASALTVSEAARRQGPAATARCGLRFGSHPRAPSCARRAKLSNPHSSPSGARRTRSQLGGTFLARRRPTSSRLSRLGQRPLRGFRSRFRRLSIASRRAERKKRGRHLAHDPADDDEAIPRPASAASSAAVLRSRKQAGRPQGSQRRTQVVF